MALIECPEYNKQVSETAKTCPHCGYKKVKHRNKVVTWSIVSVLIIALAIGLSLYISNERAEARKAQAAFNDFLQESSKPQSYHDVHIIISGQHHSWELIDDSKENAIGVNYTVLIDEQNKRVVVVDVPRHPVGKALRFEDVPLWRSGEELIPMPDKVLFAILQETDPDYSQAICNGVTIDDLDKEAIDILKEKYARKQNNPTFISLPNHQALSDLKLIVGDKVTNAAVLLVGKEDIIQKYFPQAKVQLEFRSTEGQERFDKRLSFGTPFYILIDQLWKAINDRNGSVPVQEGAYLFDIPFFNEEVIREVVNNAFAHRDYRLASEIVIKQYPTKLSVISPGGFPLGVTLENILTVSSTPRNRLLADVLAMTGIVERSGQGMDVIFRLTLSEGKQKPDYRLTDDYQVTAILSATVKDPGFALFIKTIQQELPKNQKLSVFDVLTFCDIREGLQPKDKEIAKKLFSMGYLEKRGKTSAIKFILPRRYYELTNNMSEYSSLIDWDGNQVWAVLYHFLIKYGKAKKVI